MTVTQCDIDGKLCVLSTHGHLIKDILLYYSHVIGVLRSHLGIIKGLLWELLAGGRGREG